MAEEWTLATLKTYLESRIDAVEEAAKVALEAADKAAVKADTAFEKRMDSTNEWRDAMKDQQATYVTKDQAASQFRGLATAIAAIAALMGIFVWLSRGIG